jgi:hypothetical protein
MCTSRYGNQELYVLPTLYLLVLYLSQKKTVNSAPYNIDWLVFMSEMKSVYCAVRTESLNKAGSTSTLKG